MEEQTAQRSSSREEGSAAGQKESGDAGESECGSAEEWKGKTQRTHKQPKKSRKRSRPQLALRRRERRNQRSSDERLSEAGGGERAGQDHMSDRNVLVNL